MWGATDTRSSCTRTKSLFQIFLTTNNNDQHFPSLKKLLTVDGRNANSNKKSPEVERDRMPAYETIHSGLTMNKNSSEKWIFTMPDPLQIQLSENMLYTVEQPWYTSRENLKVSYIYIALCKLRSPASGLPNECSIRPKWYQNSHSLQNKCLIRIAK